MTKGADRASHVLVDTSGMKCIRMNTIADWVSKSEKKNLTTEENGGIGEPLMDAEKR
jgi:hypothetical protein